MAEISQSTIEKAIDLTADVAIRNEHYFCDLDGLAGDGDFGNSLATVSSLLALQVMRTQSDDVRAALEAARARAEGTPVWASGKSYGGRMASMAVAEGADAAGLVFLGYPLHPPGKPEQLRDAHLYDLTVPMLFLQGTNDPFAKPVEQLEDVVRRIGPNAVLEWIDGGGHSFEVAGRKRTQAELGASAAPSVMDFLRQH